MNNRAKNARAKRTVKRMYKDKHVPSDAEVLTELRKSQWGNTFLTQALSDAEKNVRITYILRPGYFAMLDALGELMQRVNAHLQISTSDISSLVIVSLFGRAIGSFLAAVRLATSGQITESYAQLRACMENALYAFYIKNDRALAKIWLNRHESSQAERACKDSFKVGQIWKSLKSQDVALEKRAHKAYDTCIDFGAHPNERSVTMNIEVSKKGGVTLDLFNTKDVFVDLSLLRLVDTVLCVVALFEEVFPEQFGIVNSRECRHSIKEQYDRIAPGVIERLMALEKGGHGKGMKR